MDRNDISAELESLSNLEADDFDVTGPAMSFNGPWQVTFKGQYAGETPPLFIADPSGLTGTNPNVSVTRSEELSQSRNQVIVYFNDDPLDPAAVSDPKFYRLVDTEGTGTVSDDSTLLPTSANPTFW